ncbi:MAG: class I SAM-dependent methyltransferase, partial [Spirochaetaceae bacterium]|nr:class I SAM-dependent methyltransferase [Spirochaetaceae bacterium]
MKRKQPVKTWSTPVAAEEQRPIPCALCGGGQFKPALLCEGFSYVRCRRCGLVQMNPQPAGVARRYRDAYGADYLSYELANEEAFLALQLLALKDAGFDALEKELTERVIAPHGGAPAHRGAPSLQGTPLRKSAPPPHVLDVGCATGALLLRLRDRGWRVTGVEISPSAEYARGERLLDVRSLPLEENHFPGESFDLILASHLIEHLNDPGSFVREARRLLRPGGRFLVTTPNIAGFQARLFGGRWRSAIFDHLYLFSIRTLKAMLSGAGFAIEGVYTWGGIAAGAAPSWLKRIADRAVKPLRLGDVMLIRC